MAKIYLERIVIKNFAPFDNGLDLTFSENEIAVLSAINGKGKTTIMSWIVDAFHTIAKEGHDQEYWNNSDKLYRVSSPIYMINKSQNSVVYLRFKYDNRNLDFIELRAASPNITFTQQNYDDLLDIPDKIPYNTIKNWLAGNNGSFARGITSITPKESKDIFSSNTIAYFPAYRDELPAWLNDIYKDQTQEFSRVASFAGYLPHKIEINSNIHNLTNWILDVILDKTIYPTQSSQETTIQNTLNQIIRNILNHKISDSHLVRLGVGKRNSSATRIAVVKDNHGTISDVYPNLYNMSSGELAIIDIFAELLRQADIIQKTNTNGGIVIIDEIDKHLHIKLQKEVLPALMQLFPNIQFIVSSHAPFFGLGLSKNSSTKLRSKIIDLDISGAIVPIESTELYNETYENYISKEDADKKIRAAQKPIIFTEGKTDHKIISAAWNKLNPDTPMPFDLFSCGGGRSLNALLQGTTSLPQKIIGIFDHDDKKGVAQYNGLVDGFSESDGIKSKGDTIFVFCLPIPDSKKIKINDFEVEDYFPDSIFPVDKSYEKAGFTQNDTGTYDKITYRKLNDRAKTSFATDVVPTLSSGYFSEFSILFDKINSILNTIPACS